MIKEITGFSDYVVSDTGEVMRQRNGYLRRVKPDRHHGYRRVSLFCSGEEEKVYVHRLVLEAFVGPCPDGLEACHGNGVKADCALDNLRWDTRKNNSHDRIAHGTTNRGERHGLAKLTADQVVAIREAVAGGATMASQGRLHGVSGAAVQDLIHRRRWGWL